MNFRHVGKPFLIQGLCAKLPVKYIFGNILRILCLAGTFIVYTFYRRTLYRAYGRSAGFIYRYLSCHDNTPDHSGFSGILCLGSLYGFFLFHLLYAGFPVHFPAPSYVSIYNTPYGKHLQACTGSGWDSRALHVWFRKSIALLCYRLPDLPIQRHYINGSWLLRLPGSFHRYDKVP